MSGRRVGWWVASSLIPGCGSADTAGSLCDVSVVPILISVMLAESFGVSLIPGAGIFRASGIMPWSDSVNQVVVTLASWRNSWLIGWCWSWVASWLRGRRVGRLIGWVPGGSWSWVGSWMKRRSARRPGRRAGWLESWDVA